MRPGIPTHARLHTYPSAATTLLKLARDAGKTPRLPIRRIFATSEGLRTGQRAFLEDGYGANVVATYGHPETCVFAWECEYASGFHVVPQYGVLELVDAEGNPLRTAGQLGEITGTGFNNPVMPLVRYRTADFAAHAAGPCRCGRPYPRIEGIKGRWLQELIVRPDGGFVSITALNMHSDVFSVVQKFQFVQREPGVLIVRVVPGQGYTPAGAPAIQRAVSEKLGASIRVLVETTDDIAASPRGKQRFLIQELDLGVLNPFPDDDAPITLR